LPRLAGDEGVDAERKRLPGNEAAGPDRDVVQQDFIAAHHAAVGDFHAGVDARDVERRLLCLRRQRGHPCLQGIEVDARRVDLQLRDHGGPAEQGVPRQHQPAARGEQDRCAGALGVERDATQVQRRPREQAGAGGAGQVQLQPGGARLALQHGGEAVGLQQQVDGGHHDERGRHDHTAEHRCDQAQSARHRISPASRRQPWSRTWPRLAGSRPSTKASASNARRSVALSPRPTKRIGRPNSRASANTTPPFAVPSSLVTTRPVTPTIWRNWRTWLTAFWPVVPSITISTSCGASASSFFSTRAILPSSSIRPPWVCRRPAVSAISTSVPRERAACSASKITLAASASWPCEITGTPLRSPQVLSCSTEAERKVSPAASSTLWPSSRQRRASLPIVVVLPTPLMPTVSTTKGLRPTGSSGCCTGLSRATSASRSASRKAMASANSRLCMRLRKSSTSVVLASTPTSAVIRVVSSSSSRSSSSLGLRWNRLPRPRPSALPARRSRQPRLPGAASGVSATAGAETSAATVSTGDATGVAASCGASAAGASAGGVDGISAGFFFQNLSIAEAIQRQWAAC